MQFRYVYARAHKCGAQLFSTAFDINLLASFSENVLGDVLRAHNMPSLQAFSIWAVPISVTCLGVIARQTNHYQHKVRIFTCILPSDTHKNSLKNALGVIRELIRAVRDFIRPSVIRH